MRATFKNVLQQEQHRHKPRLILKIRTHHVCSPLFAALAALSCCCSGPPPAPLLRLHLLLLPPLMRQPLLLSITLHRARQQRVCEYCRACVCESKVCADSRTTQPQHKGVQCPGPKLPAPSKLGKCSFLLLFSNHHHILCGRKGPTY